MAERVQLSRKKGAKLPPNTVMVARPSDFGNPFTFKAAEGAGYTRQGAVSAFEDWVSGNPWACPSGDNYEARRAKLIRRLPELRGKNLACWCPLDQPCHADVLLDLANAKGGV